MMASIIRIGFLLGISAAAWVFYPKIKPVIQPLLANPQVLGSQALDPVISKVNDILPDNIQIPVAKRRPSEASSEGGNDQSNLTNSSNNPNLSTITNSVIDQVKQKAGEAAQEQIDVVKKETGSAFCAALIETIKKQCGVQ